ncbi:MAG: excisionase family DNA binding protein [Planctomycetota bacterium]|jgi:excisionase family DNA binding protein
MPTPPISQISPKQLARAVGVSESSIKRWANEGRFPLVRTVGGHRRIAFDEAIRFIREAQLDVVAPDAIGLGDLGPVQAGTHKDHADRIRELLTSGDSEGFRAALVAAFVSGESLCTLCDGPIRKAMESVGELWLESESGIYEEHRLTALATAGLVQAGLLLGSQSGRPIAVGGALRDDLGQLATLMASTVLMEAGFQTVDIGANTPAASFMVAIERHQPALVWISANHIQDSDQALADIEAIIDHAVSKKIPVVIGGSAVQGLGLPMRAGFELAHSMGELSAYAKGIGRGLDS